MAWRVFLYDFQGACSDMKLFVACVLACMMSGTASFAQEPFIVLQYGPSDGPARQSAEGRGQAWTVFRVTELAQSSAIISPMNAARAPDGLVGVSVRFSGGMQ